MLFSRDSSPKKALAGFQKVCSDVSSCRNDHLTLLIVMQGVIILVGGGSGGGEGGLGLPRAETDDEALLQIGALNPCSKMQTPELF